MNQSSDAAEQIVRMSLEGFEVAAKVTGSGAKNIAVLLYTIMKNKEQTSGKSKLSSMLKSGKPLTIFTIKKDNLAKFQQEAKRYGILYCALVDKKDKSKDGIVDIVVRKEDSSRINRIVERFKFAEFNKAEIISSIEKNRESVNKGKEQNPKSRVKKKEDNSLNPHLAKTEKSPLSKPFSEVQKTSPIKGNNLKSKKPSVRAKLNDYKKEIKDKSVSKEINIDKNINKSKGRTK
ncbi:MAG: PcfB family protein [Bacilli bacterium]|nr:PcfB family protein [Bacilli bacterium]